MYKDHPQAKFSEYIQEFENIFYQGENEIQNNDKTIQSYRKPYETDGQVKNQMMIKVDSSQQNQKIGDLDLSLSQFPQSIYEENDIEFDIFSIREKNYGDIMKESNMMRSILLFFAMFFLYKFIMVIFEIIIINNNNCLKINKGEGRNTESKSNIRDNQNEFSSYGLNDKSYESKAAIFSNNQRLSLFQQRKSKSRKNSMQISTYMDETKSKLTSHYEIKRKQTNITQIDQQLQTSTPLEQVQIINQKMIWQKKWIKIFYFIHKLKKLAIQSSIFFRPNQLNMMQVKLIQDQGSSLQFASNYQGKYELGNSFQYDRFSKYISYKNYRKTVKFIMKNFGYVFSTIPKIQFLYSSLLQMIFQYCPLFHYLSGPYILWEIIIFISTAILFLYIPFEYAFESDRRQFFINFITIVCPIIFGLDIFIRANTKSTENAGFIENHIKIFHNYLKSDMILDIISLISLNNKFFNSEATYFLFFIRITKSFRVVHLLREQFLLKIKISGIISLLILLAQLLFFAHLVCCLWFGVGKYESYYNQGWVIKYDIIRQPVEIQYLRSFYYSVITMTTIGYGDITPQSDYEKMLIIFVAFISCGVFGYSINFIGKMLLLTNYKTKPYFVKHLIIFQKENNSPATTSKKKKDFKKILLKK